eukprot:NODE_13554_length_1159_cov_4.414729.p1 GENE.NODE_13554_length_1159_cov_4.414729~~NODE_13554_length_1159_cov_4.414729.p1  ORF type:complete len:274 (-),score=80.13 NODE_13554_length_1159_cov_4.414729:286-1107(-)
MAASAAGVALRAVFRDPGSRWVLGGWALFTAENVILSEYRTEIKRAWGGHSGPTAYQSLYTGFSVATMGTTCFAYWRFARHSFVLRTQRAPMNLRLWAFAFRAVGLFFLGQLAPPINLMAAPIALGLHKLPTDMTPQQKGALGCPFDMNAHKARGEVYGITRITRRPEVWGLAAVGIGGALVATTAAEVAFFGVGPLVCFAILGPHSDRTQRKGGGLTPESITQTSQLPFIALLTGAQSWSALKDEVEPVNAATAVCIAALYIVRPPWLRWVR